VILTFNRKNLERIVAATKAATSFKPTYEQLYDPKPRKDGCKPSSFQDATIEPPRGQHANIPTPTKPTPTKPGHAPTHKASCHQPSIGKHPLDAPRGPLNSPNGSKTARTTPNSAPSPPKRATGSALAPTSTPYKKA